MVTKANPTELFDVEYKGLSTDEKPTDCAANSLFLELDTGKFYYFDGEAWNELGTGGGGGGGDIIYDGKVTFALDPDENISGEFTAAKLPADGDVVYVRVVDGDNFDTGGVWEYSAGDGEYVVTFNDDVGIIYLGIVEDDLSGYITVKSPLTTGEKSVLIQKDPFV